MLRARIGFPVVDCNNTARTLFCLSHKSEENYKRRIQRNFLVTDVFHCLLERVNAYEYFLNHSTNSRVSLRQISRTTVDIGPGVSKGASLTNPGEFEAFRKRQRRRLAKARRDCAKFVPFANLNPADFSPSFLRNQLSPRRECLSAKLRQVLAGRERLAPHDLIPRLLPLQFACVISPCHLRVHRSRARAPHFQPFVRPASSELRQPASEKKRKNGKEN